MEILIISGLSGAGKSKAASYLEDMGFYIVDNMPAGMMLKFAEFCAGGVGGRYSRVALVYDVRTAGSETELSDVLAKFRTMKVSCRLLFLHLYGPLFLYFLFFLKETLFQPFFSSFIC